MNVARNLYFMAVLAISAKAESIVIDSPMSPPDWAFAQRVLIRENAAAIEFAAKYIDPRGHFRGVERLGERRANDVMETFRNWPLAHALGSTTDCWIYERISSAIATSGQVERVQSRSGHVPSPGAGCGRSDRIRRTLGGRQMRVKWMAATSLLCATSAASAQALKRGAYGGMYSYYVRPPRDLLAAFLVAGRQEIAFSMSGSIWKIKVGDSVAQELTANRTYDSEPSWSPDGRWIAYTAEDSQGVNLMLLNVATGESTRVVTGGFNLNPAWVSRRSQARVRSE
jgi:hypothetical protein